MSIKVDSKECFLSINKEDFIKAFGVENAKEGEIFALKVVRKEKDMVGFDLVQILEKGKI